MLWCRGVSACMGPDPGVSTRADGINHLLGFAFLPSLSDHTILHFLSWPQGVIPDIVTMAKAHLLT